MSGKRKEQQGPRIQRPCRQTSVKEDYKSKDKENAVTLVRNHEVPAPSRDVIVREIKAARPPKSRRGGVLPSKSVGEFSDRLCLSRPSSSAFLSEPDLNTVHRLGSRMLDVKNSLSRIETLGLPETRCLSEDRLKRDPEVRKEIEQEAATGVNFLPDEVIFRDLQTLDISETEAAVAVAAPSREPRKARKNETPPPSSRDPEPRIELFHSPYQGEDYAVVDDSDDEDGDEQVSRMQHNVWVQQCLKEKSQETMRRQDRDDRRRFLDRLHEWGFRF